MISGSIIFLQLTNVQASELRDAEIKRKLPAWERQGRPQELKSPSLARDTNQAVVKQGGQGGQGK